MHIQLDGLAGGVLRGALRRFFGSGLSSFELFLVDAESVLFSHKESQVDREAVGVVESPDIFAIEFLLSFLLGFLRISLKQLLASIQRSRE